VELVPRVFSEQSGAPDQARQMLRRLHPVSEAEWAALNASRLALRVPPYRLAGESGRLARDGACHVALVDCTELGIFYDSSGGPGAAIDCLSNAHWEIAA
jgi:hypothetical protein